MASSLATAIVFVYRNLVKALPWYSSVRNKLLDPAYAGWFLKFSPDVTHHVPNCSTDASGTKCSAFYHDQEQTPRPGAAGPTRVKDGAWYIYNNTNDVSGLRPGWKTITDGGPQPTWDACRAAAEKAGRKMFTWWVYPKAALGDCWFSSDWNTTSPPPEPQKSLPTVEAGHVSGYRPDTGETPPPSLGTVGQMCANGVCDCGPGLPCGEYLWDHRNASLREWLVDEFVGGPNGLANPSVDGFFFDDGWSVKADPVPSWAPPSYRQCDMAVGGGATEEDFFCTRDMGLTPGDVQAIHGNWSATMAAVMEKVDRGQGFVFQQLASRDASLDLKDPRPGCAAYMRKACMANSTVQQLPLLFEFTRKAFHDPFPLPFPLEDVAMFLLVRGPYAWIGYSWMGCNTGEVADFLRPKEVNVDYGMLPANRTVLVAWTDTGTAIPRLPQPLLLRVCDHRPCRSFTLPLLLPEPLKVACPPVWSHRQ